MLFPHARRPLRLNPLSPKTSQITPIEFTALLQSEANIIIEP